MYLHTNRKAGMMSTLFVETEGLLRVTSSHVYSSEVIISRNAAR